MQSSLINPDDLIMLKDVLEHYLVQPNGFIPSAALLDEVTSRRASRWILHTYQQMSRVEITNKHAINGIILTFMVEVVSRHSDTTNQEFPAVCLGEFSALLAEAMPLRGQAARPDEISSLLTSYQWTQGLQADFYAQLSDLEDLIEAIGSVWNEAQTGRQQFIESLCDYYTLAYFSHIPRGVIQATNTRILVQSARLLLSKHPP